MQPSAALVLGERVATGVIVSLESIRPTRKDHVFDVVEAAGFDTSDWVASARNCPVKANPKYCYEWAFVEPGRLAILNLWWDMFEELPDGSIVHRHNFREDAAGNVGKPTWVMRATRLDRAVQEVVDGGLELRVVINHGRKRNRGDPNAERSHVTKRQLDPEPWTVARYDPKTGAHVIVRGAAKPRFVDQFAVLELLERDPTKHAVSGFAYGRDRAIRTAALNRANGQCEYCGTEGFRMAGGGVYLETHHVVPLCEGGKDSLANVAALCPNDHKKAHYGADREAMRTTLLDRIVGQ